MKNQNLKIKQLTTERHSPTPNHHRRQDWIFTRKDGTRWVISQMSEFEFVVWIPARNAIEGYRYYGVASDLVGAHKIIDKCRLPVVAD